MDDHATALCVMQGGCPTDYKRDGEVGTVICNWAHQKRNWVACWVRVVMIHDIPDFRSTKADDLSCNLYVQLSSKRLDSS